MAISPILNSAMIQRTDDVAAMKQHQDAKPLAGQQNAQVQMARKADEFSHQVVTPSDSSKADTHADAREEGKNKYFSQKKKDEKSGNKEGRVVKKHSSGSFDVKV